MAEEKREEKIEQEPDIYCDGTQMAMTPYDVMIQLLRRSSDPSKQAEPLRVGTLRMSTEHAKVFAIMLRKNLKAYEDQAGQIPMHPNLMKLEDPFDGGGKFILRQRRFVSRVPLPQSAQRQLLRHPPLSQITCLAE